MLEKRQYVKNARFFWGATASVSSISDACYGIPVQVFAPPPKSFQAPVNKPCGSITNFLGAPASNCSYPVGA